MDAYAKDEARQRLAQPSGGYGEKYDPNIPTLHP